MLIKKLKRQQKSQNPSKSVKKFEKDINLIENCLNQPIFKLFHPF